MRLPESPVSFFRLSWVVNRLVLPHSSVESACLEFNGGFNRVKNNRNPPPLMLRVLASRTVPNCPTWLAASSNVAWHGWAPK